MKPAIIAPEPEAEPVTLIGKLIELWRGGGRGRNLNPKTRRKTKKEGKQNHERRTCNQTGN